MIALYFRGYQLCDSCSNGNHTKYAAAIRCDCDICCDDPSTKP
jgi:hypothetical protein